MSLCETVPSGLAYIVAMGAMAIRFLNSMVPIRVGLNSLLSDPNFRRKLLKRIEEGWTFEKIEPMSTEEIFARLNRLGVTVTPEGASTVLSVADHGPGIPERERERVFMDFCRPGEELTRESPGAGIGLALVRRLAESMGGSAD